MLDETLIVSASGYRLPPGQGGETEEEECELYDGGSSVSCRFVYRSSVMRLDGDLSPTLELSGMAFPAVITEAASSGDDNDSGDNHGDGDNGAFGLHRNAWMVGLGGVVVGTAMIL